MNWCRPHNRFHSEPTCPACERRVVVEAGRLPYRVTNPHPKTRCRLCWNLIANDARGNPVCRCASEGGGFGGLPGGAAYLTAEIVRRAIDELRGLPPEALRPLPRRDVSPFTVVENPAVPEGQIWFG